MAKKSKIVILILAFFIVFQIGRVGEVKALNLPEISNLIAELKLVLMNLKGQLKSVENASEAEKTDAWCHDFNINLGYGLWGEEVFALQTALKKEGLDAGPDKDLKYFKTYTREAVSDFQEKYRAEILDPKNLKSGTGFAGELTRFKLNKLYGCQAGEIVEDDLTQADIEMNIEPEIKEEPLQKIVKEESEPENPPSSGEGISCFDSDGGKDYYIKGYAQTGAGEDRKEDSCRYFYTKNQSVDMLYEAYCQEGEVLVKEYECPQGCRFSACVEDRQSDIVFYSFSLIPKEPVTTDKATLDFTLENLGNLKTPDELTVSYSLRRNEDGILFSEGEIAINHALTPEEKKDFSFEVPESFEIEGNYSLVLIVDPENQIHESKEDNNQKSLQFFVAKKQICLDSDEGKVPYVAGYTTMDEGKTKNSDVCIYDKQSREYKIKEWYCQNNIPETVSLSCSQGCLLAACVEKQLVAHWSFDNGFPGSASGAKKAIGISGNALSFEGSGYLRIKDNDSFDFGSKGTIEAWVKYDSSGKGGSVLSKCDNNNSFGGCNYALKLENLDFGSASFWAGSESSGLADSVRLPKSVMQADAWYHLVSVFDGFYLRIYVNGELKKTSPKTFNSPLAVNDSDLLIGAMNCGFGGICDKFSGTIDEVKIYNYALTKEEVKEAYAKYR